MLGSADFQKLGDIIVVGGLQVVSGTTVVRDIKSNFLLQGINTEHSQDVEGHEERSHDSDNPGADPEDSNDLASEEIPVSEVGDENSLAGSSESGNSLKFGIGEKTDGDDSPGSVGEVDRDGVNSVINLHGDKEFGESVVDESSNNSDDNGGPWVDNRASCGDTDKTREGTVHGHGEIVGGFSGLHEFNDAVKEHGGDASSGSGEGGGDGTESGSGGRFLVGNGQGRSRVESVPSEPKDEGSQDLKGNGVGRERGRSFKGVSVFVVESASARSKNDGGNKGTEDGVWIIICKTKMGNVRSFDVILQVFDFCA